MLSNHNKGTILFATIYISVFLLSGLLALSKPILIQANPSVANAVITAPTVSRSSSNIRILVIEIIIISILAFAEMRYKALSRLYAFLIRKTKKYKSVIYTLEIFIAIGISYYLLEISGIAWFLFLIINAIGIYIVYRILLRKLGLKALVPVFITFLSFLIMWPFILLIVGKISILLLFLEFAYFPVVFLISTLVMRHPTKNRINAVAFSFSVLLPPIIGTLFIPIYAVGLLAIFAIYDFIAVFLTKHMQFMAQKLLSLNVPEAFMIGDFEMIKKRVTSLGKNAKDDKVFEGIDRPLIFGVGDAVLPGVVISSFVLAGGWLIAIFATVGAIVGVVANLWVLRIKKRVLPALPLIFSFMIIVILIGFYIWHF
ncbi:MAG: presenilin family intramembrane aspartyl protease [Candidatus Micrarchaeaceae archaeon]